MSLHRAHRSVSLSNSTKYYFGFFGDKVDRNIALRCVLPSETKLAIFDCSTGTLVSSSGTIEHKITTLENGYFWCLITFETGIADSGSRVLEILLANGTTLDYVSDDTSHSYVWGIHFGEAVSNELNIPYVPTLDSSGSVDEPGIRLNDTIAKHFMQRGRIAIVIDFRLKDVDIITPLWTLQNGGFDYLECKIIDEELTINNVDIAFSPYVTVDTNYRCLVHVYPDGTYKAFVKNRDTDELHCNASGSGITYTRGTLTHLILLASGYGSGQVPAEIQRIEVR